ncbi:winged helix-turn-helix domain-containing protein [Falsiroseomonas oryziterrae]|uniref:winged helix-turn-helix domain-containing protein n=1 Tax=Falsiroseomonas oryziterrae TaxID=2911368 RepID=UPI001F027CCE|nr:winged helix-turn-helix domain-containing protein [Roseomonas sp. NPKOSM-4]
MATAPQGKIRFGCCVLDDGRGTLASPDGTETVLRPKTLELLRLMLRNPGRVVSRQEILDAVWPNLFVTDDSITQCVVEIRKAMGAGGTELLKTVPRRGYLLQADVAVEPLRAATPFRSAPSVISPGGVPVVAVLPFRVPSQDPELLSVADGVLDGVVGTLATLREPVVISANSTRPLAQLSLPLGEVGERLGASYVASGSLRRVGETLRIAVELAEAATSAVLWQRSYDLPANVSIEVEDEVASVISRTLVPRMQDAELRRGLRQAPADWTAYQRLLEARQAMLGMERSSFEEAGEQLRQAIAMDPTYAGGPAALARWYSLRLGQGWSADPAADSTALFAAAAEAVRLDPNDARSLALLGHQTTVIKRAYGTAIELFDRALGIAPNDSEVLVWSAPTYIFIGEPQEAIRRLERAIRLSPEDPLMFRYHHFLSLAHLTATNWSEAAHWGRSSMRLNPNYTSNLRATTVALVALRRLDEARDIAAQVLRLEPGFRVRALHTPFAEACAHIRDLYARYLIEAGLPS